MAYVHRLDFPRNIRPKKSQKQERAKLIFWYHFHDFLDIAALKKHTPGHYTTLVTKCRSMNCLIAIFYRRF